ncbi:MAG: hypothetical protein RMK01_03650 [Thermomicrobium sp.]|nr:hypothetical protein [Thermomicrobium sp.]MDW8059149.1 hypothetical protein [Thermomicrobium sp.]
MRFGDDFDRAVLLAIVLLAVLLAFTCVGLGAILWFVVRPSSS